jgi:hypothetical protein
MTESESGDEGIVSGMNDVRYEVRKEVRLDAAADSEGLEGPSPNLDSLKWEPGMREAGEMRSDSSSSFKATGGVEMVGRRGVDSEFARA